MQVTLTNYGCDSRRSTIDELEGVASSLREPWHLKNAGAVVGSVLDVIMLMQDYRLVLVEPMPKRRMKAFSLQDGAESCN